MDPADLNSLRRELSNGGLGIVVTLPVRSGIVVGVFILGVQSSCSTILSLLLLSFIHRHIWFGSTIRGRLRLRLNAIWAQHNNPQFSHLFKLGHVLIGKSYSNSTLNFKSGKDIELFGGQNVAP